MAVNNLVLLALGILLGPWLGWATLLAVHLPVVAIAGALGVWLFYVQHSFEESYWVRRSDWDPRRAAVDGSSFYDLPAVLRWITCNIGYHHIHHLSPRIPNYHLRAAHEPCPRWKASRAHGVARQFGLRAHEALGRGPRADGGFSAPRGWHLMARELPYAVTPSRSARSLRRRSAGRLPATPHILIIERRSAASAWPSPSCCQPAATTRSAPCAARRVRMAVAATFCPGIVFLGIERPDSERLDLAAQLFRA